MGVKLKNSVHSNFIIKNNQKLAHYQPQGSLTNL